MFKKILITTALVAIIGVLVFGAVNRTLAKSGSESEYADQGGYGRNSSTVISAGQTDETYAQGNGGNDRGQGAGGSGAGELANLPAATSGDLSAEESAALIFMREEEKLAHDVYVTLYAQWGLPVFQNISQSEQTHTDSVKTLLDRYGLSDPASSVVGVFTNPDLQSLYNDLVARGSQSLAEAIKVGAAIEEIDILDLQERLAQTDNADIQQVFNNLLNGSYNHLRAFVSTLNAQTGETYQPQYLGAEDQNGEIHNITQKIGHFATVLLSSKLDDLFAMHVTAHLPEGGLLPHDLIICDQGRIPKPRNLCIALINGHLLLVDILAQDPSTGEFEWQPFADSAFALENAEAYPERITPDYILATASRMIRRLAF